MYLDSSAVLLAIRAALLKSDEGFGIILQGSFAAGSYVVLAAEQPVMLCLKAKLVCGQGLHCIVFSLISPLFQISGLARSDQCFLIWRIQLPPALGMLSSRAGWR